MIGESEGFEFSDIFGSSGCSDGCGNRGGNGGSGKKIHLSKKF